ncbi:WGxxGxxG family protein [Paenibacillus qinlingensis]|uniref:MYXO-CTERM domain-containing protein n=1 Tax=Paenibacillus qinlingensis TaxID=1837343 RepID=A0ABU1P416_9BACL|nr:WGxxGxxG family protein [Paenibacillus qinlingensis]MDR6553807.1 MYXO-CTERM domain-containing protein [Paenibacillus qinlingensis]
MKKFRTITLAVALTTALSMGAASAQAKNMDSGNAIGNGSPIGTLGTTTSTGYTGSNYDATSPGMGLGGGIGSQNFSGNGTNGVYNGNLTNTNSYNGYGTTERGTGVMDHMNGYGTNPIERGANAVERGVQRGANAVERGVDRSANMVDRMSTKSIGTTPPSTYRTNSYRANATTDNNNGSNWGWLGLVGLLGLAGLRSSNSRRDESYK